MIRGFAAVLLLVAADPGEVKLRFGPEKLIQSVEGQDVETTVWGSVVAVPAPAQGGWKGTLSLEADLADLQGKIPAVVKARVDREDECGEVLQFDRIVLSPEERGPQDWVASLQAVVYYERWACVLGRRKRLLSQEGTVRVRLVPTLVDATTVELVPGPVEVTAGGALGVLLRNGLVEETLAREVAAAVRGAVSAESLQLAVPSDLEVYRPRLESVQFADRGEGRLGFRARGSFVVTAAQAAAFLASIDSPRPRPRRP